MESLCEIFRKNRHPLGSFPRSLFAFGRIAVRVHEQLSTFATYKKKCFRLRNSSLQNNGKALPLAFQGKIIKNVFFCTETKFVFKGTVSRYSDRQCYLRKDSNGCERPQQFLLVIAQCGSWQEDMGNFLNISWRVFTLLSVNALLISAFAVGYLIAS
jgi:hypothetical protein